MNGLADANPCVKLLLTKDHSVSLHFNRNKRKFGSLDQLVFN